MKYLLDTSILLWYTNADEQLPKEIVDLIEDRENRILVSVVSLMELVIKRKINKLPEFKLEIENFQNSLLQKDIEILPVNTEVLKAYESLVFNENHKDPFDRFILSTGWTSNSIIITSDSKFKGYRGGFEIKFVN